MQHWFSCSDAERTKRQEHQKLLPFLFLLEFRKNFLDDFASYDLKDLLDATPQEKAARR